MNFLVHIYSDFSHELRIYAILVLENFGFWTWRDVKHEENELLRKREETTWIVLCYDEVAIFKMCIVQVEAKYEYDDDWRRGWDGAFLKN